MPNKSRARFLPILIMPAILPAMALPVMLSAHVPDSVLGATFGFCIGLSLVGLIWMARGKPRCAQPGGGSGPAV
ncbi:MAG: hypothetical protein JWP15_2252 [Alphaproteobacteria bacterium]|nr:hypothetical protein [Alphaproteobacteria bacterium]